jgi:hypothetical protein
MRRHLVGKQDRGLLEQLAAGGDAQRPCLLFEAVRASDVIEPGVGPVLRVDRAAGNTSAEAKCAFS